VTTAPRPGVIVDGTWHKRETCNAHDGLTAAVPSIYRVKDETMQQTQLRTSLPDDDWRKHDPRFREPQLSRHLDLVERLTTVAGRHDTTPGAVAIAWTVRNPAVDGAIVGFRRADQVDPILTAASIDLTGDDVDEMEGR
jgi:aryl-alcohol dehydrogenase-like predicted oxidoreductase